MKNEQSLEIYTTSKFTKQRKCINNLNFGKRFSFWSEEIKFLGLPSGHMLRFKKKIKMYKHLMSWNGL